MNAEHRSGAIRIATGVLTASTLFAATASSVSARDAAAGKALYSRLCLACHHPDGRAKVKGSPNLSSKAEQAKYTDAQFVAVLKNGKKGMPPYKSLNQQQMNDVVAYVRTLAKNP